MQGDETADVAGRSEVTTVARSVLSAYFDTLATTEGFAEIAPKLRSVVLEQGHFNEDIIRAAMFPDGS